MKAGLGCASAMGLVLVAWAPGARAQAAYTGAFAPQAGQTGVSGSPLVTADWTSVWTNGGDYFTADSNPYDIVVGPDANLYALTNNATGAGTGPSAISLNGGSLTNYGILNSYPINYPVFNDYWYNNTQPVVSIGSNTVINNYGVIGFQPYSGEIDTAGIIVANGAVNSTVNNYGTIVGMHGVYNAGSNVWTNNYAGAKIIAWFGTPIEGGNGNNFLNAGLINDIPNGSYCFHPGYQKTVFNWGYCIASANGFWLDQKDVAGTSYGGPLVPAAHDLDGNLVYNGGLTGDFSYSSGALGCDANNAIVSDPIQAINNAAATLNNTVYTVAGNPAQIVNYLPLTFGYPMLNLVARNGTLTFNLSHLTAAQQAGFSAAVAASYGSYTDSSGTVFPHVSTGSYVLDGQNYQWCTFGTVNLNFTDTIAGTGVGGNPVPGVLWGSTKKPKYYVNASSSTNPYYLLNAATVLLTGTLAEPAGKLTVQPGWTLAVGAHRNMLVNNVSTLVNQDDTFSAAPAAGNSINLETATATTPDNVNGTQGYSTTLAASLVIDNPSVNVVLPNLAGGGSLIQSGTAVTTLAGTKNTITGPLYLANGTLRIAAGAAFKVPPVLMIGTNDGSRGNAPIFDISQIGANSQFTLTALSTPGYQMQMYYSNYSSGLQYPLITLGSNTLVVGTGKTETGSFLGGLRGTGGLVVAKGTTLSLGPLALDDINGNPAKLVPISTFSGGTSVSEKASLVLQNPGALGTGALVNQGSVALGNAIQFAPTFHGASMPASAAMPNHTVSVPTNYTQGSKAILVLKVAGADTAATADANAGVSYETLSAGGAASLAGTLQLNLINGYVPAKGAVLEVVKAASVSGGFSHIDVLPASAGVKAEQVVAGNVVTVTLK